MDTLNQAIDAIRRFFTETLFQGGVFRSLTEGFASQILVYSVLLGIAAVCWIGLMIMGPLARAKVHRQIDAAREDQPSLIAVLVLRPSGFPIWQVWQFLLRRRKAFTDDMMEGLEAGLEAYGAESEGGEAEARMRAFLYPARGGRVRRKTDTSALEKRAKRYMRRAEADLAIAVQQSGANAGRLLIIPRAGSGEGPSRKITLAEEAQAHLAGKFANAAAFFAVGMAGVDQPPFEDWVSVHRVRYLEQLAVLVSDPPEALATHALYPQIVAAFDAAGEAAMKRDFLSDTIDEGLIQVRRTSLVAAEATGEGVAEATLALGDALWNAGQSDAAEEVLQDCDLPRAAYLRASIVADRARLGGDRDALAAMVETLRSIDTVWHSAGLAAYLEAHQSQIADAGARWALLEEGVAAARAALAPETGLDRARYPDGWASTYEDRTRMEAALVTLAQPEDQAAALTDLLYQAGEALERVASTSAPKPAWRLQRAKAELAKALSGTQAPPALRRMAAEARLDAANAQTALLPPAAYENFRASALFARGGALRTLADLSGGQGQSARAQYGQAAKVYEEAAALFGDTPNGLAATTEAAFCRLLRARAEIGLAVADGGSEREPRLREAKSYVTASMDALRGDLSHRFMVSEPHWRAGTHEKLAIGHAALADIAHAREDGDAESTALDAAADEMQRAADMQAQRGDRLWADRHAEDAARYRAQAAAVREAAGLVAPDREASDEEGQAKPLDPPALPPGFGGYGAFKVRYGGDEGD